MSRSVGDMRGTVAYLPGGAKPAPARSVNLRAVCEWLADQHGGSVATWESRMHGGEASCYARVAQMNAALRRFGLIDKLCDYMNPVEVSMEGECRDGRDPELRAQAADAFEDVREVAYRETPGPATARALLVARAVERATSIEHDRAIAKRWGITL